MQVNLAISALPLVFGGISFFETVFLTFGFFVSLLIKEVNNKNEYLFYYNNGISKIHLWIYSYVFNLVCLVTSVIFINLIGYLF